MSKFIVYVREEHVQKMVIDAEDAVEAKHKVLDGDGDPLGPPEFLCTNEESVGTWRVDKVSA